MSLTAWTSGPRRNTDQRSQIEVAKDRAVVQPLDGESKSGTLMCASHRGYMRGKASEDVQERVRRLLVAVCFLFRWKVLLRTVEAARPVSYPRPADRLLHRRETSHLVRKEG